MKRYIILFLFILSTKTIGQTISPADYTGEKIISLEWASQPYSYAGGASSVNTTFGNYLVVKDANYFRIIDNDTHQDVIILEMETNEFSWIPTGDLNNNGSTDYIFIVYKENSRRVKLYDPELESYFYDSKFVPFLTLLGLVDYNGDKIYELVLGQSPGTVNYYGVWDYHDTGSWIWRSFIDTSIPLPNTYNFLSIDLNNNGINDIIVETIDTLQTQSLTVHEGSTGDLLLEKTSPTLDYVLFGLDYVDSDSLLELLIYELDQNSQTYRILIYSTDHAIPSALTADNESMQPNSYRLYKNYPNPFNPYTTINFEIPKRENIDFIIYNILGQETTRLKSGILNPGTYSVIWDGKDKSGIPVSSGVYIYVLKTKHKYLSKRMTLIK